VALIGSNCLAIARDREALLRVFPHHAKEVIVCSNPAASGQSFEQIADRYPSLRIKHNPSRVWAMTQNIAKQLAETTGGH
jgi:hypothetical protein